MWKLLSLIFEILNSSLVKFVKLIFLRSIIFSEISILSSKNFNLGDSLFLILESQMSPHVMYGNAVLFSGLSRSIGSSKYYCGALQYTTLIFRFSSLHTLRQNIKRHNYYIQCIYLFIMTIYFYYYNTMHRYINTHLSV